MPRSKNNVKRPNPQEESVVAAANLVLNNDMSIRKAAKLKQISKSMLSRQLKIHKESGRENFVYVSNYDTKRVFSDEDEILLQEYCLKASKFHYGLSKEAFLKLCYEFAVHLKKEIPESWHKNRKAGNNFYYYFFKRHSQLSLRKPEATSLARATAFNKTNVNEFFQKYEEILTRDKFSADSVYNVDESGLSTVHVPLRVIAPKGQKQIGNMTSGERGSNVTLIACVNALGNSIPPCLIFPRVHYKNHMTKGAPPETLGLATQNGWSNTEMFEIYFDHFLKHVNSSKDKKILLILDNHESHLSIRIIEKARENNIIMLTFPPHTSHKLQPLDRSVFGPLKKFYNKACSEWLLSNPGKPMTIYEVAECFGKSYPLAFTPSNIQSGFRVSGIWPFNSNIFSEDEFLSSYVTDRPIDQQSDENIPIAQVSTSQPSTSKAVSTSELKISTSPQPSTSKAVFTREPQISTSPQPSTSKAVSTRESQVFTSPLPSTSKAVSTCEPITPESIRPFPKAACRKIRSKPNLRKGKCRILTDTPEKNELEAKAAKRKAPKSSKRNKNVKVIKKKILQDNDSNSDEHTDTEMVLESDSGNDEDEGDNCVGCGENYFHTKLVEDWIQCKVCRLWCHENCTAYDDCCSKCNPKN